MHRKEPNWPLFLKVKTKNNAWNLIKARGHIWGSVAICEIQKNITFPKNHGISKLVVWRSQNPAIQIQTPLFWRVPWFSGLNKPYQTIAWIMKSWSSSNPGGFGHRSHHFWKKNTKPQHEVETQIHQDLKWATKKTRPYFPWVILVGS